MGRFGLSLLSIPRLSSDLTDKNSWLLGAPNGRPDSHLFKAVLDGDMKAVAASGEKGVLEITLETSTGIASADFHRLVSEWIASTHDHKFNRLYNELIYQPMIELLSYL